MKRALKRMPFVPVLGKAAFRLLLAPWDGLAKRNLAGIDHPYASRFLRVLNQLGKPGGSDGDESVGRIESERRRMLACREPLVDGSLGEAGLYDAGQSVADACAASKPPKAALFLYLLIREFQPTRLLELGTNVGVSAAYQAAALQRNGRNGTLVTLEASAYRLRIAERLHETLGLRNVSYRQGVFRDTLERTLIDLGPFDYAFIDGHHQYQPTLDYFNAIRPHASDNALFVLDDIRWSQGMRRAWRRIQSDARCALTVDLGSMGVCVVTRETVAQRRAAPPIRAALI